WRDIKLSKEDQYACMAHLGFVFHERPQEEKSDTGPKTQLARNLSDDVPTRFILREIEHFLERQKLFSSVVDQRAEAKRFLELMREEAGLIIEREFDGDGEKFYGFVHRSFQEYFAAADVYER